MKTINELQGEIERWHERRFPWAGSADVVRKLKAEALELDYVVNAQAPIDEKRQMVADEAADVMISVLALLARWRIDPIWAIENKFNSVVERYGN